MLVAIDSTSRVSSKGSPSLQSAFASPQYLWAARYQLDFFLQIARTAEVVATGLSFARSLGCKEEATSLIFGFRWTKIHGRLLTCWVDPRRRLRGHPGVAHQNEYVAPPIVVPLETPPT